MIDFQSKVNISSSDIILKMPDQFWNTPDILTARYLKFASCISFFCNFGIRFFGNNTFDYLGYVRPCTNFSSSFAQCSCFLPGSRFMAHLWTGLNQLSEQMSSDPRLGWLVYEGQRTFEQRYCHEVVALLQGMVYMRLVCECVRFLFSQRVSIKNYTNEPTM